MIFISIDIQNCIYNFQLDYTIYVYNETRKSMAFNVIYFLSQIYVLYFKRLTWYKSCILDEIFSKTNPNRHINLALARKKNLKIQISSFKIPNNKFP